MLFGGLFGGEDKPAPSAPEPRGFFGRRKKPRSEMGFFEHLEELRVTIIKCIIAAIVGMAIVGTFFIQFFDFLQYPLYRGLGDEVASHVLKSPNAPMGTPAMVFSISIYGGVVLMLPFIAYFIVQFIAPGLNAREKGMLRPGLYAALGLFFFGALTCFFVMLPAGLYFSYFLDVKTHVITEWTEDSYYSLVVWATLGTGLVFEFPLILVILQVLGIISPDTLRAGRRYALVIIMIVGGLMAPSPDIGSMLMMMAPMVILYEGSIIVGAALRRRRLAAAARREAENAG